MFFMRGRIDWHKASNLILFGVLCFHVINIGGLLYYLPLFQGVGLDFRLFWSAGYAANHYGMERIYDFHFLSKVQKSVFFAEGGISNNFTAYPVYFLPIFILPFQLLALLELRISFLLWTFGGLIIYYLYLGHFYYYFSHQKMPLRRMIYCFLFYPLVETIITGQVNIWLMVCIGEFLRSIYDQKYIRGGVWLGGLLLKPQTLILFLPVLVWLREWNILKGFLFCAMGILLGSLCIGGMESLLGVVELYRATLIGEIFDDPQRMINWRMVGLLAEKVFNFRFPNWISNIGIIGTISYVFFFRFNVDQRRFLEHVRYYLVVIAGGLLITWVSHFHMAIILLPFILLCWYYEEKVERVLLNFWVLTPALAIWIAYCLGLIVNIIHVPLFSGIGGLILGVSGFCAVIALMKIVTDFFCS